MWVTKFHTHMKQQAKLYFDTSYLYFWIANSYLTLGDKNIDERSAFLFSKRTLYIMLGRCCTCCVLEQNSLWKTQWPWPKDHNVGDSYGGSNPIETTNVYEYTCFMASIGRGRLEKEQELKARKELKENETKAEIPIFAARIMQKDALKPPIFMCHFYIVSCSLYGQTYVSKTEYCKRYKLWDSIALF